MNKGYLPLWYVEGDKSRVINKQIHITQTQEKVLED